MQRWYLNADLNEGNLATVSPLAFESLLPIFTSVAQEGIKPHFLLPRCRFSSSSAVIVHICNEGAMFHEGEKSTSPDS